MDNKGGRTTITLNGQTYSGRAKGTVKPAKAMRESGVNQNGTGYSTTKPVLPSISLTFDRGIGILWNEDMLLADVDCTYKEIDLKRPITHLITAGTITGTPEIDTESGEVTGLTIEGDSYRATVG